MRNWQARIVQGWIRGWEISGGFTFGASQLLGLDLAGSNNKLQVTLLEVSLLTYNCQNKSLVSVRSQEGAHLEPEKYQSL